MIVPNDKKLFIWKLQISADNLKLEKVSFYRQQHYHEATRSIAIQECLKGYLITTQALLSARNTPILLRKQSSSLAVLTEATF